MSRTEVDGLKKMAKAMTEKAKSPVAKPKPKLKPKLKLKPQPSTAATAQTITPPPATVDQPSSPSAKKTNQAQPKQRSKLPLPPPRPINHPLLPTPTDPLGDQATELDRLARRSYLAQGLRAAGTGWLAWAVAAILIVAAVSWYVLVPLGFESFNRNAAAITGPAELSGLAAVDPADRLADDLALIVNLESDPQRLRDALRSANVDALQLQADPDPIVPLPDLEQVRSRLENASENHLPEHRLSFDGRDPRLRSEMVRDQGGSTITEAAVANGIRWLASVQNKDGGWSLKDYKSHDQPDNPSDTMATSLALLPMLGAGQTHQFGYHKTTVNRGLAWLISHQLSNGDLRSSGSQESSGMDAHGQATIVLCEALAMTGDPKLVAPAQAACRFIEASQHGQGGWPFKSGMADDVSVFGWQVLALHSGRSCPAIDVDESTLSLADFFLDQLSVDATFESEPSAKLPDGSVYAYQASQPKATPAMTAEAILCRIYQGWKRSDPRLGAAVTWLLNDHLPSGRNRDLCYWYYATQVMHHYGGAAWHQWNDRMRSLLLTMQQSDGPNSGSWGANQFERGPQGGRIYSTSLAVCTLEVYYRHLRVYP